MSSLDDDERAVCLAYVDGLLSAERRRDFERRLEREPELAKRVQAVLATDAFLRRVGELDPRELERARRRKPWVWAVAVALGACVLVAIAFHLLGA
ncbi:MAG: hypothetical protein IT454_06745 [Planctomycetes bacterium]|nr:hypothetical protein [Planctomycetota bacterium]